MSTIEPQLVDADNHMAIMSIDLAKEMLKEHYTTMVEVFRWIPYRYGEQGIVLNSSALKKTGKLNESKQLQPIIKGVVVTWMYSEDKILKALKIFSLLGWENPSIYCPNSANPMMIRSGKRYSNSSKEPVLLIAPRLEG